MLINAVCEREARIHSSFDVETIKKILIEVAAVTRVKSGNVGPLSLPEIQSAFERVVGHAPIDQAGVLLQRLPGLGRTAADSEDRQFVDTYMLDGLRASNVLDIIERKDGRQWGSNWSLSENGLLICGRNGIGLLKARRYRDLYRLFSTEISTPDGNKKHVVSHLLLGAWEGMRDETVWKLLPGLKNHKTALSDHLHEIFEKWTENYIFVRAEFTRLFEEFELLGSLAFTTLSTDKATLQAAALKSDSYGHTFVWTPIGRAGWDGQNWRAIIESWQGAETVEALLDSGFARKDHAYLTEAIGNLNRLADRVRRL